MKKNHFSKASSLVLLALFFSFHGSAQIPKLFLKFVEKQNKVQSGYVKLQSTSITDDRTSVDMQDVFFISTPKELKFLTYNSSSLDSSFYCKSARTLVSLYTRKDVEYIKYRYEGQIQDPKYDIYPPHFYYSGANGISLEGFDSGIFQRITPKINKKNIRFKILYLDNDMDSNRSQEYEFEKRTFNLIQQEASTIYFKTEWMYGGIEILEQSLYEYIHPDILDTISFKFEEIKKGYDKQNAVEQSKRDSIFQDSIVRSITENTGGWIEALSQNAQKDTLFFMPEWKFPLLSGDTIYSESINSRFLFIDMWYVSCHPCRLAMYELSSIDTLYDESLLKMVSLNVSDKDTAKMSQVVKNLNLKCDIACAFDSESDILLSKKMGNCRGYPQLYLIEMKSRQVIWHSCGYYEGFTKDIEEIITAR